MPRGAVTAKRKFLHTLSCTLLTISSLAPKYEELASLYVNNADYAKKVVIAKVDATLNDVPDEIQGFPTIKLYPAGAKDSPVDYSGSRTIEDLATFIKENGKYKIDAYVEAEDAEMPDADEMGKAAPAASKKAEEVKEGVKEAVKSKVSEAAQAVKTAVADSDGDGADHDEL